MGILPWSFGCIFVLAILAWASFGRVTEAVLVHNFLVNSLSEQARLSLQKVSRKARAAYTKRCPSEKKEVEEAEDEADDGAEDTEPLRTRRRLTRTLNIGALFSKGDTPQKAVQERLFKNLLTLLYGSVPIFTENGGDGARVLAMFDEAIQQVIAWSPKIPADKAEIFANVEFEGADSHAKQAVLFLILSGADGECFVGKRSRIPPLLPFVSAQESDTCLSLYLAPKEVLTALFEDEEVASSVVEYRNEMFAKIRHEGAESLASFSSAFKSKFAPLLPADVDEQFIDFRVTATNPKGGWRPRRPASV